MQLPNRIHIFGASGSGTTTLGLALAERYGHRHFDTDDFYWLPTDPPYQQPRPTGVRLEMLHDALDRSPSWVLSGSLCGWGDPLIARFDLAIFLYVPPETRMARLTARELERYGCQAIAPGGSMHRAHLDFLDWVSRYDTGGLEIRSRTLHEAWLAALPCPVIRLEGDLSVADQLVLIEQGCEELFEKKL